ncbi:MAG: ABC transporter permease [Eubacterium sp.]|nr:ABC transporter permease [Eubacterium sp.]
MVKYVLKKLAIAVVTLFVILLILFLMMELLPGSPFNDHKLSVDQKQVLMESYGLDKPVWERFFIYIGNLLKGDFGVSYVMAKDVPVSELIGTRMPITIIIGLAAMVLGSLTGLILGFLAAFKKGKVLDVICRILSIICISVPSYIFAIVFSYFLGFRWKVFPLLFNYDSPVASSVMAVLALSVFVTGVVMRFTRDEAATVLASDYVLFARGQGISNRKILFGYVMRNSMMPIITIMAMLLVSLMSGSLVTESIFAIPGIGFLLTSAIANNDYNVVLALSFVFATLFVTARLILDLLYGIIDPRVRVGGVKK